MINYFIYSSPNAVDLENTSILIIGDSHPRRSINPKYFDNAKNISRDAEPFVITYWKLKKIFKSNVPDTIIIGFAPHNISKSNDLNFSKRIKAERMFKESYPFQQLNDISSVINIDYITFYQTLWKQTGFYPRRNHIILNDDFPWYINNLNNCEGVAKRHYYHNGAQLGFSQTQVNYLDSIINLTNSNKIKLIIVSSPVHSQYLNKIPFPILEKYDGLIEKYNDSHIIFDKTRESYPDSLLMDSDHLNQMGAKRFTTELIEYVKEVNH